MNTTVAKVPRVTMHREPPSSNNAGIAYNSPVDSSSTSMVDLKLYPLAFTSCSRGFSSPSISKCAMLLDNIQYTELVNCTFHDNGYLGTALLVNNTNIILDKNEFVHNYCVCESFNDIIM